MRFARLSLLLLPCAWLSSPAAAYAQPVQRCIGADGRAVYTDQRCATVGAAERLPAAAGADAPRLFNSGCPRVLSQLVGEIGTAIRGGEVNRLASVYDWSGVSNAAAAQVLDRLEAIVDRPLVDIAPVYPDGGSTYRPAAPMPDLPEPPPAPQATTTQAAEAAGPDAWMPSWNTRAAESGGEATGDDPYSYPAEAAPAPAPATPAPVAPARPRPVALRIEQTLAGSATPVRTVFGLRRSYGCFWIAL